MGTSEVDRIITGRELREMVRYSLMQIWRLERDGRFPKRIKLGPGRVGCRHAQANGKTAAVSINRRLTEPEQDVDQENKCADFGVMPPRGITLVGSSGGVLCHLRLI